MLEARRVSLWRNRYEIVADGLWDSRTRLLLLTWTFRLRAHIRDQASEDWSAGDSLVLEVCDGVIRPWREQLTASMRPVTVVMADIASEDGS
jgi:hypothetical protein